MTIALHEIRRSKARFALLSGAIGLLVFLLLFFQAVAGALVDALTGGIERTTADVLVYDASARSNPAVSVLPADVTADVAEVTGVTAAAPVGQAFAVATNDATDEEVVVIGIEVGAPGTPSSVDEGRLPRSEGETLFGASGFAEPYEVGDAVELREAGLRLEVVGRVDDAAFNATPTLYVPYGTYEALVRSRVGPDVPVPVSYVAATAAASDVDDVAAAIERSVGDVQALSRAAAVDALPGISTITRSFGIIYALLYLVVAIVTGVFFLILTVQKRDALVLLRAIGADRRDLVALVLRQVVFVVGLGVIVGAALAVALLAATQGLFGAGLAASTIATSGLAVLTLGLVAAVGAVRRVAVIEPAEASRTSGLS